MSVVTIFGGCTFKELLVVRAFMAFVKSCGKPKVCKFDMTTLVEKNVVRLDVTARVLS